MLNSNGLKRQSLSGARAKGKALAICCHATRERLIDVDRHPQVVPASTKAQICNPLHEASTPRAAPAATPRRNPRPPARMGCFSYLSRRAAAASHTGTKASCPKNKNKLSSLNVGSTHQISRNHVTNTPQRTQRQRSLTAPSSFALFSPYFRLCVFHPRPAASSSSSERIRVLAWQSGRHARLAHVVLLGLCLIFEEPFVLLSMRKREQGPAASQSQGESESRSRHAEFKSLHVFTQAYLIATNRFIRIE